MKKPRGVVTTLAVLLVLGGLISCKSTHNSALAAQAVKPADLAHVKFRTLKAAAVGESTGFKFLWIPFVSPTEAEAKRDLLERLKKEGIDTIGKNIAYMNVTSDYGGFGLIGIIGAPAITLTADVIEILGGEPPQAVSPQN